MIGARPRYGRIEQLTDTLLAEADVTAPPVPVGRIIGIRGITIEPSASLGDVSGLVLRRGKEIIIGVNKKQAPARQRFTLAHELAHALLHPGKEVRFDKGLPGEPAVGGVRPRCRSQHFRVVTPMWFLLRVDRG
jgi:hypothetical protein